ELAIARVAEAGDDVALLIQAFVERRYVDRHIGIRVAQRLHALGRGDEADVLHAPRAPALEDLDRRDGRAARREHRIEDEADLRGRRRWQLVVVLDRSQRALVAEEADVP